MSLVTQELSDNGTEVYTGDAVCQEKLKSLLNEMGFPSGIFPLKDIAEFRYSKGNGFIWVRQNHSIQQNFETMVPNLVLFYSNVVAANIEYGNVTGILGVSTTTGGSLWTDIDTIVSSGSSGDPQISFTTRPKSYPVWCFEPK